MNQDLLWVNKNSTSTYLSRSSKAETARIRAHVQHLSIQARARRKSAPPPRTGKRTAKQALTSLPDDELDGTSSPDPLIKQEDTDEAEARQTPPVEAVQQAARDNHLLAANALTWLPNASPEERRSFVFFLQRTAREWSGYRDVAFWNILVPQFSAKHEHIFHSVVALGALHEKLESTDNALQEAQLQQMLWRQCSKAAQIGAQRPVADTIALMSCIILVCLQNLQSNPIAFQMLKIGCNLVLDIERRVQDGVMVLPRNELSLLQDYLKPILERLGTRYCFIVDLPSAFALHVGAKHNEQLRYSTEPILPDQFHTLLEARNALEMIADWSVINATSIDSPGRVRCRQNELVEHLLLQWETLLETVPLHSQGDYPGLQNSKGLLKAAGLVTRILFDTLGSAYECEFDKHIEKFREITSIYDQVSSASQARRRQKISFGIDTGIIHTLAFVVGRCRDPHIRREALRLLERDDHVEGDMRASTGSNVLHKLIELEEGGRQILCQEEIQECERVRIWQDQQYWHDGVVQVHFIRSPYDPARGAQFQEEWTRMPIRISDGIASPSTSTPSKLANVVYARGMAAFLDENTGQYHHIVLKSFFLPIPRM